MSISFFRTYDGKGYWSFGAELSRTPHRMGPALWYSDAWWARIRFGPWGFGVRVGKPCD